MKPEEGGDEWRRLPSGLNIRSLHKMGKDSESSNHFALAGRREQLFITQIAGAWNLSTYKIPVFKKLLEHLPSHLKRTLFKYAGYMNCMLDFRCICTILYTVTGIPLTAFGNASYCLFQCCAFPDCCIGVLQPCCDQTWLFPILCHIQLIIPLVIVETHLSINVSSYSVLNFMSFLLAQFSRSLSVDLFLIYLVPV